MFTMKNTFTLSQLLTVTCLEFCQSTLLSTFGSSVLFA